MKYFGSKQNGKKFSHELLGVEINANENKANYGMYVCMYVCTCMR